jgi:hypothetical protein
LISRGVQIIRLHSLHGTYTFPLRRFFDPGRQAHTDFFALTGEPEAGGMSHRLAETTCFYANRLSFRDLEDLLDRTCGRLPRQTLHRLTERVATDMSADIASEIASTAHTPLPQLSETVDIYDPTSKEVLVMEDGILVKAQKPKRGKDKERPSKWINTDVVLLERPCCVAAPTSPLVAACVARAAFQRARSDLPDALGLISQQRR